MSKNLDKFSLSAKLYQQDLAASQIAEQFEAIIMPTGSFCLLPKDKILDILSSFYQQISKKGRVIFDIEMPVDFVPGEISVQKFPLTDQNGILFTSTSDTIDWQAQKTSYIHRYELLQAGKVIQTEISHFVLFWYGIDELTRLLNDVGFHDVQVIRGYGVDDNSSLYTFIATK